MSTYKDLPSYGSGEWKEPVATAGDLPLVGNEIGEVRVAQDSSVIYVWDGASWIANANGDIVGPGSSTDQAIVRFDGTGGTDVQNSGVLIDDNDNVLFQTDGTGSVGIELTPYPAYTADNRPKNVLVSENLMVGSSPTLFTGEPGWIACGENIAVTQLGGPSGLGAYLSFVENVTGDTWGWQEDYSDNSNYDLKYVIQNTVEVLRLTETGDILTGVDGVGDIGKLGATRFNKGYFKQTLLVGSYPDLIDSDDGLIHAGSASSFGAYFGTIEGSPDAGWFAFYTATGGWGLKTETSGNINLFYEGDITTVNLLWDTDAVSDIGSPDGGTTLKRARDLYLTRRLLTGASIGLSTTTRPWQFRPESTETGGKGIYIHASGGNPMLNFGRINGTIAAPTATASGNQILGITALGYGTSAYRTITGDLITANATETWTNSAAGTELYFRSVLNGGAIARSVISLRNNGDTVLNPDASVSVASNLLWGTHNQGNIGGLGVSSPNIIYTGSYFRGPSGANFPNPLYSFNNDTDTGIDSLVANTLYMICGGTSIALFNSSGLSLFTGNISSPELVSNSGSAADPSITFNLDNDTGFFRPGADIVGIATAGSERFRIDSIEGKITGNLRVTGNLGVGNSVAATTLGTVTKKVEVFDSSGVSLGFIPVYDSIT
jgi:hypothetical protein